MGAGVWNAHAFEHAQVYGEARLSGEAMAFGKARLFGAAQVCGEARVLGDARISRGQDVLVVYPIGSESVTATLARTAAGHILAVGCWNGTVDGLQGEVERRARRWRHGTNADQVRWRAEYAALETLSRARIAGWSVER